MGSINDYSDRSIDDYSDNEFIALVKELNKQDTYLEKVKFFYDKTQRYKGEKRTIKDKEYSFSLLPQTQEEKLIWWEYFLERRALKYCEGWLDDNASGMDRVEDRNRTIGVLLDDIKGKVNDNDDHKRGYEYGIKKTGLDSINFESFEIESIMAETGKGLGLYYAELELNKLEGKSKEEEFVLNIKTDFSEGYRLVLMEELGIIEYLKKRCEIPFNEPGRLIKVLGELMGIDVSPQKNTSFVASAKHLLNGDVEGKGPSNPKSRRAVAAFLTKLNIPLSPNMKNR